MAEHDEVTGSAGAPPQPLVAGQGGDMSESESEMAGLMTPGGRAVARPLHNSSCIRATQFRTLLLRGTS
jgi:hypothetical protein